MIAVEWEDVIAWLAHELDPDEVYDPGEMEFDIAQALEELRVGGEQEL